MDTIKTMIQNRKGQKISVLIDLVEEQKGLAFVMHGLSGNKNQEHIKAFAKAFTDNGYTTVRFDTTNTFGESDGDYMDATVTNYYTDLEDVIAWAKTQEFYYEPFFLSGHSLGGMCTTLFAQKHPSRVKGLAPISATVSGKLSIEKHPEKSRRWKEEGWIEEKSKTPPFQIKKLPWSHMEDRLKYDLLKDADKLSMNVLLIVGTDDFPESQELLFKAIPHTNKELHYIKDAPHTFVKEEHLDQIYRIFDRWIKTFEQ